MHPAAILIDRVGYAYAGRSDSIIDNVSLAITPGAVTALVGRSSSGKSTLLHIIASMPKTDIARRVDETLALVGPQNVANSRATALSGGQAQRVALARALVMQPDVPLLDEPFAALDLFTRLDLQRDIRAIAARLNITVVLVSHDIAEIARMADRAAFLAGNPGRIVAETVIAPAARHADDDAARSEIARLTAVYEQASKTVIAPNHATAPAHTAPVFAS